MAEKPQPVKLYWEVCSLPPQYFEFGPDFAKCQPWLVNNDPHLYPDLLKEANDKDVEKVGERLQSAGITSSGGTEGVANSTSPSGDVLRSIPQEEVKHLLGGQVKKKVRNQGKALFVLNMLGLEKSCNTKDLVKSEP